MTKRIKLKPPKGRRIVLTPSKMRAVDPEKVREALGGEWGPAIPRGGSPFTIAALRRRLLASLRSDGGRPKLEGTTRRQKIPLSDADWEALGRAAELLASAGVSATRGQVAAQLLRNALAMLQPGPTRYEQPQELAEVLWVREEVEPYGSGGADRERTPAEGGTKLPPQDLDSAELVAALQVVSEETDRGCALALGAWLDEALTELLHAHLVGAKEVLLHGIHAPLGTCSSRIHAAYATGLIDEDEWRCLNVLRQVVDGAAHFDQVAGFGFSFNLPAARDRIFALPVLSEQLQDSAKQQDKQARVLFCFAAAVLIGRLRTRTAAPSPFTPRPRTDWVTDWSSLFEPHSEG